MGVGSETSNIGSHSLAPKDVWSPLHMRTAYGPWSIIRYALPVRSVACMACRSFFARPPFDRYELETFPRIELTRCNG